MPGRSGDRRLTRLLLEAQGEAALLREQLLRSDSIHRQLVRLLEIGWGVDLGQIAAATLDAAVALMEVDAAMLVVDRAEGKPFVTSYGLAPGDERRLRVLVSAKPLVDPRPVQLPRLHDADAQGGFAAGYAVPLASEATGALVVLWREAPPPGDQRFDVLAELALTAGVAIANERVFDEVREAAARDPLTGLYNRRIFHDELARATSDADRYGGRLALCLFDVDDFKQVNTKVGHLDGDAILVDIAACVAASVRAPDVAGRIGGDEFAVLLPHSNVTDGARLYDRIAAAVRDITPTPALPIAISAGIAQFRPGEEAAALFRRADQALALAKGSGKSRQTVAEGDDAVAGEPSLLTDDSSGLAGRSWTARRAPA